VTTIGPVQYRTCSQWFVPLLVSEPRRFDTTLAVEMLFCERSHYLTQHHYIQGDYYLAPLYAANGNPAAYSDFTSRQCPTKLLERLPYFQKVLSFFESEFAGSG
jgi:hypothetical protein